MAVGQQSLRMLHFDQHIVGVYFTIVDEKRNVLHSLQKGERRVGDQVDQYDSAQVDRLPERKLEDHQLLSAKRIHLFLLECDVGVEQVRVGRELELALLHFPVLRIIELDVREAHHAGIGIG